MGTFNYSNKTIYIEAHYGSSDMSIRQFKKADNGWEEVIPVKPMSIINRDLYSTSLAEIIVSIFAVKKNMEEKQRLYLYGAY